MHADNAVCPCERVASDYLIQLLYVTYAICTVQSLYTNLEPIGMVLSHINAACFTGEMVQPLDNGLAESHRKLAGIDDVFGDVSDFF